MFSWFWQILGSQVVTAATLTGLLDKLEEREYVSRIPDYQDGRAKIVISTSEGDKLVSRLIGVMHRFEDKMLAGFSAAERALLTDWLHRIAVNLGDSGRDGCE